MFYAGSMGYFAQYISLGHITAISRRNTHNLSIGYGSFGYEPNVNYLFGVPTAIETGGVAVDVRIGRFIGTHNNNLEIRKLVNQQVGMLSSALESAVPELMFHDDPLQLSDGVSTIKALSKASAQGQRIYHITSANQAASLPNINHSSETMAEITNALSVGKEIITHTDAISVPGWSGAGYIILDPITGDSGYKISGGVNGALLINLMVLMLSAISFWLETPYKCAQNAVGCNRNKGWLSENISQKQSVAKVGKFLGVAGLGLSIAETWSNEKLSSSQKFGQISVAMFGFFSAAQLGILIATAGAPVFLAVFMAVLVAVSIHILSTVMIDRWFSRMWFERDKVKYYA